MNVVPIAELSRGRAARVRGVVRRASSELLASRLGERPCVYWDVRQGLDAEPYEREGQDFWVEDATGRALVRAADLIVEVLAERQREVISAADADYAALADRLRELKAQLKTTHGPAARSLREERARLAKAATLLLAIRAHARGRVHVAGSLAAQDRWIRENALTDGADGQRSIELVTERWEVVIAEGQEVEVEGVAQVEHAPSGSAASGYRDLPTCVALTGSGTAPVRVRGLGASAPAPPSPPTSTRRTEPRPSGSAQPEGSFGRHVLLVVMLIAALSLLVWLHR